MLMTNATNMLLINKSISFVKNNQDMFLHHRNHKNVPAKSGQYYIVIVDCFESLSFVFKSLIWLFYRLNQCNYKFLINFKWIPYWKG